MILDPRFPGGTSAAAARELRELDRFGPVDVVAITSAFFRDRPNHPDIDRALADLNIPMRWDPPLVNADIIILHNPAFLKFNADFAARLVCDTLIVVTHENITAPGGALAFDADACFDLIDKATLARTRIIAPVSPYNRQTVADWLEGQDRDWHLSQTSWTNICDFDQAPPTSAPADRRGRHSRPGFEKFPDRAVMETLYPPHARANVLLGADIFMEDDPPDHWSLYRFREIPVDNFLEQIDFFVYFTNGRWRESFGRAIAEAIAAGKLVLTDPGTASTFGRGVIGLRPAEVEQCIKNHIQNPDKYIKTVRQAQRGLLQFTASRFRERAAAIIDGAGDLP